MNLPVTPVFVGVLEMCGLVEMTARKLWRDQRGDGRGGF